MAYAFDKTMSLLGKAPTDDKADIFGGGGSAQQGAQFNPQSGRSTEGELSGGGDVSSSANNQSGDVSASAAYRANVGKSSSPANLAGLRTGLDSKSKALQNEANDYVSREAGPSSLSDFDKDTLRYAIGDHEKGRPSGDEPLPQAFPGGPSIGGGGPSMESMDYWTNLASGQVEGVNPFKSSINLKDDVFTDLRTDAGIQNLMRKGGGAEYNAGDAAFDQALLSQDKGFQADRDSLLRDYDSLLKTQDTEGEKLTSQARSAKDSAKANYLQDLKNTLQGFQGEYETAAKAKEKEIEDAALKRQGELMAGAPAQLTLEQRMRSMADDPANAALKDYFSTSGIDPGTFASATFNPDAQDWKSYLGDDDALRFNNIMSLLGGKDVYQKGGLSGGLGDSDLYKLDTNAMDQALMANAQGGYDKAQADAEAARQAAAAEQAAKDEAAAKAAAAAGDTSGGYDRRSNSKDPANWKSPPIISKNGFPAEAANWKKDFEQKAKETNVMRPAEEKTAQKAAPLMAPSPIQAPIVPLAEKLDPRKQAKKYFGR